MLLEKAIFRFCIEIYLIMSIFSHRCCYRTTILSKKLNRTVKIAKSKKKFFPGYINIRVCSVRSLVESKAPKDYIFRAFNQNGRNVFAQCDL